MGKRKHGNGIPMGYQWDTNWSIWSPKFHHFHHVILQKKNMFSPRSMLNIHPGTALHGICPRDFWGSKLPRLGWKSGFPPGAVLHSFTLPLWNKCSFHAINSAIQPPKRWDLNLYFLVIENQYPLATMWKTTIFIGTSSTSVNKNPRDPIVPLCGDFPDSGPTSWKPWKGWCAKAINSTQLNFKAWSNRGATEISPGKRRNKNWGLWNCKVVPPKCYVYWFINPMNTIDISPIITYKP